MKKYTPIIVALLASLTLITSHLLAGNTQDRSEKMETLYGIQLHKDKLEVRVRSNGCTEAGHFSVQMAVKDDTKLLTVVREKADRCRKMTRIISIELEPLQAENMTYQLVNPLQSG